MKARQQKKQAAAPIEIASSFSYKLNHEMHGGAKYESSDYFQSMKTTVPADEVEATTEKLHKACKKIVLKAVNETVEQLRNGVWARIVEPHPASKTNAAAFEKHQARQMPRNHAQPMLQGELTPEVVAHAMMGHDGEHNDAYRK